MADESLIDDVPAAVESDITAAAAANDVSGQEPPVQIQETPEGYMDADGNFTEGWIDRLGGEYKSESATLSRFKTFGDLLKSHMSQRRMMGDMANAVKIPKPPLNGDKAQQQTYEKDLANYRKALGIPDSPEGYKIERPSDLPEDIPWSEENAGAFSALAHKHNLTPDAVRDLLAFDSKRAQADYASQSTAIKETIEKGQSDLRKEWGSDYDSNISFAKQAAKASGLEEIEKDPGFRSPGMVRFAAWVGKLLQEDRSIRGHGIGSMAQSGESRAQDIISGKHGGDPELMDLHKRYHDGDREARKYVRSLLSSKS